MASKLKKIHLELQVRDKIIGGLLQIITEKELLLPDYLLAAINLLYYKKINKGNKNDDNTSDASGAEAGAETKKAEAEEKKEIH